MSRFKGAICRHQSTMDDFGDDLFNCRSKAQLNFSCERSTRRRCCCCQYSRLSEVQMVQDSEANSMSPIFSNSLLSNIIGMVWILWLSFVGSLYKIRWKQWFGALVEFMRRVLLDNAVIRHLCNRTRRHWAIVNKRISHRLVVERRYTTRTRTPLLSPSYSSITSLQWLYYLLVLNYVCCLWPSAPLLRLLPAADACSTRPSAKPRPPRPIWSPDLKVERENCTDDYAELFCMNGGNCFRSKVLDQYAIGCDCAVGWYGRRCEYKDVGNVIEFAAVQRVETASIAGGVAVLVILFVFISLVLYIYRRRTRIKASGECCSPSAFEEPDHKSVVNFLPVRPFSARRPEQLSTHQSRENAEVGVIVDPLHIEQTV